MFAVGENDSAFCLAPPLTIKRRQNRVETEMNDFF